MDCLNERIVLYTNYFIHFTNQITLKPSLAQKLKLIFKFSMIMGQINIPLWTHMGHKGSRKDEKTFIQLLLKSSQHFL